MRFDAIFRVQCASLVGGLLLLWAPLHANAAAEKETEQYTLFATTAPAQPQQGNAAVYTLRITPKGLLKLKRETPLTATLTSTPGLTLTQDRFASKDLQDDPPLQKDPPPGNSGQQQVTTKRIETTITAQTAGAHTITAQLTFFLCTDQICQRYKDTLALPVTVTPR